MPANQQHIIIPENPRKYLNEIYEEMHPAKVWKRPWVNRERLPATQTGPREYVVENKPTLLASGKFKWFPPIMVAIMACPIAAERSIPFIRVLTKIDPATQPKGFKAEADKVWPTKAITALALRAKNDPAFIPKLERGAIRMEEDGNSPVPRRWKFSEAGVFAPVH